MLGLMSSGSSRRGRRATSALIAGAAGLALADASVVTLALPRLLSELHTSVQGVAAILGVYTVVLAGALLPAERIQRSLGASRTGAGGLVVFALASVVCGASGSLGALLAARAVQALGGAAALVAAFALLEPGGAGGERGRRLWLAAAVLAAAVGPVLGGALTQILSWRAIFYTQAPIAAAAALAVAVQPRRPAPPRAEGGFRPRPAIALALLSAALTAVLFLLVLLLVAGWNVAPLRAALAVTVIPAAALTGVRVGGDPATRAAAGCGLVGAGVLALAYLPDAHLLWTVVPQAAAGVGMGLALPALGGELLPERDPREAARLLAVRHLGIALALVLLAPIVSHDLAASIRQARERGVAVVLDARLPPTEKLRLAPQLLAGVEKDQPRAGLREALAAGRARIKAEDRPAYGDLARRTDDTLVLALGQAFRSAFLITGALALIAAFLVLPRRRVPGLAAAAAAVLVVPLCFVALHAVAAPKAVPLRDPCHPRPLPKTGGLEGFLQDRALELLDRIACRTGSTREELVLALADAKDRPRFERDHGVDPRSLSALLSALLR